MEAPCRMCVYLEKTNAVKTSEIYLIIFGFLLMKICRENRRLSTEGKIVSKHCSVSKTQEGSLNPSPPLYAGGVITLRVRPRVKQKYKPRCVGMCDFRNAWFDSSLLELMQFTPQF